MVQFKRPSLRTVHERLNAEVVANETVRAVRQPEICTLKALESFAGWRSINTTPHRTCSHGRMS
jgi:hypothetical protein